MFPPRNIVSAPKKTRHSNQSTVPLFICSGLFFEIGISALTFENTAAGSIYVSGNNYLLLLQKAGMEEDLSSGFIGEEFKIIELKQKTIICEIICQTIREGREKAKNKRRQLMVELEFLL
jgi:hypothetical protein